eukprot:8841-Amphidinium_carterae.2
MMQTIQASLTVEWQPIEAATDLEGARVPCQKSMNCQALQHCSWSATTGGGSFYVWSRNNESAAERLRVVPDLKGSDSTLESLAMSARSAHSGHSVSAALTLQT